MPYCHGRRKLTKISFETPEGALPGLYPHAIMPGRIPHTRRRELGTPAQQNLHRQRSKRHRSRPRGGFRAHGQQESRVVRPTPEAADARGYVGRTDPQEREPGCATSSIFPVDDFHFSRSCVVPPTVFVPCSEELVARCGYPFSSAASNLSTRVGFGEVAIIDRLPVDRLRSIVTGDRPCPGIWTPPRNGRFPISTTFVE